MKIAVLSDIHSNCYALEAVLQDVALEKPDSYIVLGDTFGYFPWAVKTFELLKPVNPIALLGNHDKLVLDATPPSPTPSYWSVAKHNERELNAFVPEALDWLSELQPSLRIGFLDCDIECAHGTPDDPLNGRFYPDDTSLPAWSPGVGSVVLLGHTHYPLFRFSPQGGVIANPGSVGQPRDGNLRASWGLLHLPSGKFEIRRTRYDVRGVIELLDEMGWYGVAISSLKKGASN